MTGAEKIEQALRGGVDEARPRLVPFLTGGYPSPDGFKRLLPEVCKRADAVEIGVPFTDPMADGVTIQSASLQALKSGVNLRWILEAISQTQTDTPILLMSYLNPLLSFGVTELADAAVESGVSGFIVPDLPYEERELLSGAFESRGLALVQLVTPLTSDDRLARLCEVSRGFVYAVTRLGITGDAASGMRADLSEYLDRVAAVSSIPVMAGFGISCAEHVAAIKGHCDGAIVGSALIKAIDAGEDPLAFLEALRP